VGIYAVAEEAEGDGGWGLVEGDADGGAGAEVDGCPARACGSGAEVAGCAIADGWEPGDALEVGWGIGDGVEEVGWEGGEFEGFGGPGEGVTVEEAGAAGHGEAAGGGAGEFLLDEFCDGDPAGEFFGDFGGGVEPEEFCGPEGAVEHAAREVVVSFFVVVGAEFGCEVFAAGVSPGVDGGEWVAGGVHGEEAMPEA